MLVSNFCGLFHSWAALQAARCKRGAAFVELAIVLPFLMLLTVTAWDSLVTIVARINHRKAAIVIAKDFKQAPLLSRYVVNDGNPRVVIDRLTFGSAMSLTPVGDFPRGFLPGLVTDFITQLDNSGSASSAFRNGVMVELKYLAVCSDNNNQICSDMGKTAGAAYLSDTVVDGDGTEESYIGPGPDTCFTDYADQAIGQFKDFRDKTLAQLLAFNGASDLRVGFLLVDVDTGHPTLQRITAYAPWRPVVFWMQCSRPPYIFKSSPVLTTGVYFPDTEAAYVG